MQIVFLFSWPPCFFQTQTIKRLAIKRESVNPISWKKSRRVVTLSQAIMFLAWCDRWQMPEGLFIFCLIRSVYGDVGALRRRGQTIIITIKNQEADWQINKEKENTLFWKKQPFLFIIQLTVCTLLLICLTSGACLFRCERSVIRRGCGWQSAGNSSWWQFQSCASCH